MVFRYEWCLRPGSTANRLKGRDSWMGHRPGTVEAGPAGQREEPGGSALFTQASAHHTGSTAAGKDLHIPT